MSSISPCSNFEKLHGKDLSADAELTFQDEESITEKKYVLCYHSNYFCKEIINHLGKGI